MIATIIETNTETLTTMDLGELGPWLRRHGLEPVKVIKCTWPPKLVCLPKGKNELHAGYVKLPAEMVKESENEI